jgi:hypothetical protein
MLMDGIQKGWEWVLMKLKIGSANLVINIQLWLIKEPKEIKVAQYVQTKKKLPSSALLENITGTQGIVYTHQEEFYMDYDAQPLLPHKLSQQGPCLAVGDVNGDGAEDFFVGGSYQHQGVLFIQNAEGNFNKQPISQEKDKQAI